MQSDLKERINKYLYFNYVPEQIDLRWLLQIPESKNNRFDYRPQSLGKVLDLAFDKALEGIGANSNLVVPLSGGLDSRLILGAALDRFPAKQIKTVTYGVPGLLDYEIGPRVAREAGIENHLVDLSKVPVSMGSLVEFSRQSPWTYCIEGFFNAYSVSQVAQSKSDIVLTGFMGDPLTGGHLAEEGITKAVAVERFLASQRREKSLWLCERTYNPWAALPSLPDVSSVAYSELLDLGVRQSSCIASCVTPMKKWTVWNCNVGRMQSTGASVLAPFIDPLWAQYWLAAPRVVKEKQNLYIETIHLKYPMLAKLPTKSRLGARHESAYQFRRLRNKVMRFIGNNVSIIPFTSPALNYLNFAQAFRKRPDYIELLNYSIKHILDEHLVPWLDVEALSRKHVSGQKNHEYALLIFCGLAANHLAEKVNGGGGG